MKIENPSQLTAAEKELIKQHIKSGTIYDCIFEVGTQEGAIQTSRPIEVEWSFEGATITWFSVVLSLSGTISTMTDEEEDPNA